MVHQLRLVWGTTLALTAAVVSMPAQAAKAPETNVSASAAFRQTVAQISDSLKKGDVTTAGSALNSLSPSTPFEKYIAASLAMELAVKRNDVVAQRSAVSKLIESGGVPEGQLGHLNHVAGYLSYQTGAIDNAVVYLNRARELGVTDPHAALMLVESYVRQRKMNDAAQILDAVIDQQIKAGQAVPASWYDRAISIAYARKDWAAVARYGANKLADGKGSAPEWRSALATYMEGAKPDKEAQLDLYRLQAATGGLASERDYQGYATLAAGQGYAAEAKAVLDTGLSDGKLMKNDSVATPLLKTLTPRAVTYLASIKGLPGKAGSAANATKAAQDGDKLLANSQYAEAVPYYRAALEKGATDKDRVSTRLGIALARSGDFQEARKALAQVSGTGGWGQVATYWSAWVNGRALTAQAGGAAKPQQTASLSQ